MDRRVLVLFYLAVIHCGCDRSSPPAVVVDLATQPDSQPVGLVVLGDPSHQLGSVPEGQTRDSFTVRNDTSTRVQLLPAVASCGCSQVEYSQPSLAPNETAIVTAVVQGQIQDGRKQVRLTIPWHSSNDAGELVCTIQLEFQGALQFKPSVLDLSSFESATTQFMILRNYGVVEPVSIQCTRSEVHCTLKPVGDGQWVGVLSWTESKRDAGLLPPLPYETALVQISVSGIGRQQYRLPLRLKSILPAKIITEN